MPRMHYILISLLLIISILPHFAYADPSLFVAPTRVVFEKGEQKASLFVSNKGDAKGVYNISVNNRRMTEDGRMEVVTEKHDGELFADDIVRISPRRVTLDAGESQTVRVMVRQSNKLPDGEYRSHITFSLVADSPEVPVEVLKKEQEVEDDTLVIAMKVGFGLTIPVIVRKGELDVTANMSGLSLVHDTNAQDGGQKKVQFTINREGSKSTYGDIEIAHIDANGAEHVLKTLGGLAVYFPNMRRSFSFPVAFPDGVNAQQGKIRVTYKAKKEEGGEIIASQEISL